MKILSIILALGLSFFSSLVLAGGPFFVDGKDGGFPITWESKTLEWVADPGPLNSRISNQQAVLWIEELFADWSNATLEKEDGASVGVADIEFKYAGLLGKDIAEDYDISYSDITNSRAVIVFDADGKITDKELGDSAHDYVVGFASPIADGSDYFAGGVVVINGLFIDGDNKNSGELSEDEFKAAILHEIGHLLNLDHTQANIEAAQRYEDGDVSLSDEIPTMYPVLYTSDQLALHADDKIALAEQYPASDYTANFCRLAGILNDSSGKALQGADVEARAEDDVNKWSDVRTQVSGVLYPANSEHGEYVLGGMAPNRVYTVRYRAIDKSFTGGSSIAPFDPPKAGIPSGIAAASIVACKAGNETVSVNAAEAGEQQVLNDAGVQSDPTSSGTGGCSLIR